MVTIIPARGGSKRIPRKNIRPFNGTPALGHVLNLIKASGIETRCYVSTEDEEIASVAQTYGAQLIPRPEAISDDHTGLTPVVHHGIKSLDLSPETPVMCALPTALLIQPETIKKATQTFLVKPDGFVVPVLEFSFPPQRGLVLDDNNTITPWQSENILARSQDLTKIWHDSGQFYIASAQQWLEAANPFLSKSTGLPVSFLEAQDIDTQEDWQRAELLYRMRQETQ